MPNKRSSLRLQALDHGVVRSLHNLYLDSGSIKPGFKTPINGIHYPVLVKSKNEKEGRNHSFPNPPKKRVKNKMQCEVE